MSLAISLSRALRQSAIENGAASYKDFPSTVEASDADENVWIAYFESMVDAYLRLEVSFRLQGKSLNLAEDDSPTEALFDRVAFAIGKFVDLADPSSYDSAIENVVSLIRRIAEELSLDVDQALVDDLQQRSVAAVSLIFEHLSSLQARVLMASFDYAAGLLGFSVVIAAAERLLIESGSEEEALSPKVHEVLTAWPTLAILRPLWMPTRFQRSLNAKAVFDEMCSHATLAEDEELALGLQRLAAGIVGMLKDLYGIEVPSVKAAESES